MWPVIDFICNYFFDFVILMLMTLALKFRLALVFFGYLILIAGYYIGLNNSLYRANVESIKRRKADLLYQDINIPNQEADH